MKAKWQQDSVWVGLVIGLLLPFGVYGILYLLYSFLETMDVLTDIGFAEDFRTRTLGLISICANLVLMQTYRKTYRNETIRGILIASMILVLIWFLKFALKSCNLEILCPGW